MFDFHTHSSVSFDSICPAAEMIAAAEESGKIFTVHQNRRWDVDFLASPVGGDATGAVDAGLDAQGLAKVASLAKLADRFDLAVGKGVGVCKKTSDHSALAVVNVSCDNDINMLFILHDKSHFIC